MQNIKVPMGALQCRRLLGKELGGTMGKRLGIGGDTLYARE